MGRQCEVALLGTNSCFKTRTARDIKDGLEDACVLPKGTVFRALAETLAETGVPITSPAVEYIVDNIDRRKEVVEDVVTINNCDGTLFTHSYTNGILATNYAENPVVQNVLARYFKNLTRELHKDYPVVILEGRSSIKDGLNLFLTAPTQVRAQIKRIECDVAHLSDEEIMDGIRSRDLKDAYKKVDPLKIPPAGIIIRRESINDDEQKTIVRFGIETIQNFREGRTPLPRHQILYTYNPEISALQERIPSYR